MLVLLTAEAMAGRERLIRFFRKPFAVPILRKGCCPTKGTCPTPEGFTKFSPFIVPDIDEDDDDDCEVDVEDEELPASASDVTTVVVKSCWFKLSEF